MTKRVRATRLQNSRLVSECFLEEFGIELLAHHGLSAKALTKSQFESAIERAFQRCGQAAELAPRANPGHDITVDQARYSLKTQANRDIQADLIWISKFMELGKGKWTNKEQQLLGLRDQFLAHMRNYDRILVLRAFSLNPQGKRNWRYELVEIPKVLLQEVVNGRMEMKHESTQMPKPGYCTVTDRQGIRLQLYFDGGTERKLQIKNLRKSLCIVHASWEF